MADNEAGLRAEVFRLNKIIRTLMDRAERSTNVQGSEFSLFQTTVILEEQVQARTVELERALRDNERINRDLAHEHEEQRRLIRRLEQAHSQLLQSERMASVGQLAAGVAHEVNNPIGFINSNLGTLKSYVGNLFTLLDAYARTEPELASAARQNLDEARRAMDFDYLRGDIIALIDESAEGAARIRRIVQSLRDFAHPDETEWQVVDLHAGIETTLSMARSELDTKAEIVRDYGQLPPIECLPSLLNQVLLNLLLNAAQAIPQRGTITIRTRHAGDQVSIAISDTGTGMTPEVIKRAFEPFFTTRPVGQGAGLGLSVAYGIVEMHGGHINVDSEQGKGTTVTISLPLKQSQPFNEK